MNKPESSLSTKVPVDRSSGHISIKQFVEGKHLEALLQAKMDMLQQGAKIGSMGSWEYSIENKELVWSDGMYELYDIGKNQKVTADIYSSFTFLSDPQAANSIIKNITSEFRAFEEVITIVDNGKQKTIWMKADVVRDENLDPIKIIGADIDISKTVNNYDQVQSLNRMLIQKNRELEALNSELKTFNNIAANDYNDTLRNLYTCMEFIITTDAKNLSNASKANIRRAQTAIQKMKLMTNDIVNYSRIHTLETDISLVDLKAVLRSELKFLDDRIREADANIKYDELPVIPGFPLLIALLFHHLLENAIKFRSPIRKCEINISSEVINGSTVDHRDVFDDLEYYVLRIADNGIGFHSVYKEKIFEMFQRIKQPTKYKGSGIGLAICKKVMDLHDGFIVGEGVPDEGATFTCYFPIMR